jgi:membrane protein YdbS with pleckstrin-like domain
VDQEEYEQGRQGEPVGVEGGENLLLPDDRFRKLDRRVVRVWTIGSLIGYGGALLFALPWVIFLGVRHPLMIAWAFLGWLVLVGGAIWLSFWRPPRLYRAWGWRMDGRILETQSGLLFQRRRLLPLNRLQHVDLRRGPIERMNGLASLILHTAGTQSANLTIPGLEVAEAMRLRDHLVEIGGGDDAV